MTQSPLAQQLQICSSGFSQLLTALREAMELSDPQVRSLSPLALAYIGDAVYELFIRSRLLMPPKKVRVFHQAVVAQVRAEQQAFYLEFLQPHLSASEADIVRRGRNAASSRKSRASLHTYQQATAFETLLGHLYLTDPQRLMEVLAHLPLSPDCPPAASS